MAVQITPVQQVMVAVAHLDAVVVVVVLAQLVDVVEMVEMGL